MDLLKRGFHVLLNILILENITSIPSPVVLYKTFGEKEKKKTH